MKSQENLDSLKIIAALEGTCSLKSMKKFFHLLGLKFLPFKRSSLQKDTVKLYTCDTGDLRRPHVPSHFSPKLPRDLVLSITTTPFLELDLSAVFLYSAFKYIHNSAASSKRGKLLSILYLPPVTMPPHLFTIKYHLLFISPSMTARFPSPFLFPR